MCRDALQVFFPGDDDPPALSALVYGHISIFGVRSSFKGNVVFRLFQVWGFQFFFCL